MGKKEIAMGVGDPVMGEDGTAMGKIYPSWEKMRPPWDSVTRHGSRGARVSQICRRKGYRSVDIVSGK